MNEAGYESHMVGKWHLGSHNGPSLPSQRGFKTFLGYLNGENTYYTHKVSSVRPFSHADAVNVVVAPAPRRQTQRLWSPDGLKSP